MNRLPLEVAAIIRSAGDTFLKRSRRWITWHHRKVLVAILRCRDFRAGSDRLFSPLVHIKMKYVRTHVVAHYIQIELSTNNLCGINLGHKNGLVFQVRTG